jgi:hypothetical protein
MSAQSAPVPTPRRERIARRVTWSVLALSSAFVLVASRLLTPAASGVGTHTQLGLPPCGFLVVFGLPCPACGLTTSFAHLAHLELAASLRVHPLGLPLFLAALALLVISLHGALRARALGEAIDTLRIDRVALVVAFALTVVWAVRLLV